MKTNTKQVFQVWDEIKAEMKEVRECGMKNMYGKVTSTGLTLFILNNPSVEKQWKKWMKTIGQFIMDFKIIQNDKNETTGFAVYSSIPFKTTQEYLGKESEVA